MINARIGGDGFYNVVSQVKVSVASEIICYQAYGDIHFKGENDEEVVRKIQGIRVSPYYREVELKYLFYVDCLDWEHQTVL